MKVLILGANYASIMNSLKVGLDQCGVACKALSFDKFRSKYNDYSSVNCIYSNKNYKIKYINTIIFLIQYCLGFFIYLYHLLWADKVIYYSYPNFDKLKAPQPYKQYWELNLIRFFVKDRYVWFTGSDIRIGEEELLFNPFFKYAWNDPNYEYKETETYINSDSLQWKYAKAGFKAIVWDQYMFLKEKYFPDYYIVPHASLEKRPNKEELVKGKENKNKISIVHAPSAPVAKGSRYIIECMELLKKERNDFEFHILKDITNKEYMQKIEEADILIDQMIWGGYGVASQQALSKKKVVVCYLLPDRCKRIYGTECPIIPATIENLNDQIKYILDCIDLKSHGEKSYLYYLNTHSPREVAKRLISCVHK